MKNSERILNTALIDFLDMISQRIDDCLYRSSLTVHLTENKTAARTSRTATTASASI